MKKGLTNLSIIFFFAALMLLPVLLDPKIFLSRGNDLSEFFWPLIYFTKESLIKYHQLPFWNNLFFSGTPLLPDPQAPIFYLPNIIFLFFKNIDTGFLVSTLTHTFTAGIGMYLLSRYGFKFERRTSIFCTALYIVQPKLAGYIEAGHFGLIASWAWLPFTFLSTILLSKNPNFKKTIFLSASLTLLFYTHILIFGICLISVSIISIFTKTKLKFLILSYIITFGLIAVALLPQLSWQNDTTRSLLLQNPDTYPKWLGFKDFLKASLSPTIFGHEFIWNLDTEKIISLGIFSSIFAMFGFLKLKRKTQIAIIILLILLILISLNNISPIYNIFIKQNLFILLRVSTRFWFLIILVCIFLAGLGFEKANKKRKILATILGFLTITELLIISWTKISKPIIPNPDLAPKEVYEFLAKDKDRFRVFCLTRCLSQKESAIYNLELAEGYGTLQQKNYYIYSQQLSQAFWRNHYTLSIPPFEIYKYEKLQPYSPNLAAFNIKYLISDHILKDKNLKFLEQIDKYIIYENKINLPRSNYPIVSYSPNFIRINTSSFKTNKLILSEVYNKDWKAFINGNKETKIAETIDNTRKVDIDKNTKFVNFIYEPLSFIIGLIITSITIILIAIKGILRLLISK